MTDPVTDSAARWWARIKRAFIPDDVILLPPSAGYCPRSFSHRHCVAKDPRIGDICVLCGTFGVLPEGGPVDRGWSSRHWSEADDVS